MEKQYRDFFTRGAVGKGQFARPTSASCFCPHCNSKVSFSLSDGGSAGIHEMWPTVGTCPDCNQKVRVVFFYNADDRSKPDDAVMHPRPKVSIKNIELPANKLPHRLERAIRDTEDAFAAKLYSPALTSGRRALEGIFKHLSHEDAGARTKLFDLIEKVCKSEDATASLKKLAHAIREQGNLGAHFDLEKDADAETVEVVLELLNYLISYFFLLPEKIDRLESAE